MTVPKRQTSWRDLRAQANRLQNLEQLLAQAHRDLEQLMESHAIEKQQWLQKLHLLEANLQAMQQAEQEVADVVQQIEHQRQAAWNQAEARGLRISQLEDELASIRQQHNAHTPQPQPTDEHQQQLQQLQHQLQQAQDQLEQQRHKAQLLIESRDQQLAALQSQLAEASLAEGAPPAPWLAWMRRRRWPASRPVQIALVAGLLIGLAIGLQQWRTRGSGVLQVFRSAPSAAVPSDAVLLIRSSGSSWLEVRDLADNPLFVGMLEGEQRFALAKGVKVLAGRPDLVTVQVSGSPPRVLGTVEDVGWRTFGPGQGWAAGDTAPPRP